MIIIDIQKKNISLGFPKGNPLWSLPGKVGGLGEGKTTHRKSSVFLPPNSLPALSKLTPPENLLLLIFNIFKNV